MCRQVVLVVHSVAMLTAFIPGNEAMRDYTHLAIGAENFGQIRFQIDGAPQSPSAPSPSFPYPSPLPCLAFLPTPSPFPFQPSAPPPS